MSTRSTAALLLALTAPSAAQSWEPAPAFPESGLPRRFAAGLVHEGQLLVLGGEPFAAASPHDAPVHGLPTPSSAWVAHAPLEGPMVRCGAGVDALGRVVVFGGVDGLDPEGDVGEAYEYTIDEGKKEDLTKRSDAAADDWFLWTTDGQGRIYSIGGGAGPGGPNGGHVERYDANTDSWEVLPPAPFGVADGAAVVDRHGDVMVIGGFDGSGARTGRTLRFDVASGTWSDASVADLPVATSGLRAVLGADERIYAIGGVSSSGASAATWVLDEASNAWVAGPDMGTPRSHFALVLGPDDHVYAMGGDDGVGGTALAERLYTPPCPTLSSAPEDAVSWIGGAVQFHAVATGGAPLAYRWRRDGVDLVDGPSTGGGAIAGAASPTLLLSGLGLADAGAYSVVVSNPCGDVESPAAALTLRPTSGLGGPWTVTSYHPVGADSSNAHGIDGDRLVGGVAHPDPTYGVLEHPTAWSVATGATTDLTPTGSVGGVVTDVADGVLVGWWWWPYSTPQGTGYHQHAARWYGDAGSHDDLQPSGWEFGSVSATDGAQHVGTLRWDESSTNGDGAVWTEPSSWPTFLTPPDAWGSSATAVSDGAQYGSVHLGFGVVHAARWTGSAASFVDLNPPGSSWSYVSGAGDGQAVGRATLGGVHRAALWWEPSGSFVDLTPPDASSAELRATRGGYQLGSASFDSSGTKNLIWAGTSTEFVDLDAVAGDAWTSTYARDLDVLADGTILVAGYGRSVAEDRTEALLWRMQPTELTSGPATVSLAVGGSVALALAAGGERAGHLYLVLGSFSGTSPGLPLGVGELPLVWDAYFEATLTMANGSVFESTLGLLDEHGLAGAAVHYPPGLQPALAGLTAHHAYVTFHPATAAITLVSDPAPVTFSP